MGKGLYQSQIMADKNNGQILLPLQSDKKLCLDWIVPDNALFWLRDLTRGREEHIFFMQCKIIFAFRL